MGAGAGQQSLGVEPETAAAHADTDRQRVSKIRERFHQSALANETYRTRAIESLQFLNGDQWDDDVKARRKKKNRPSLVINKTLNPVQWLSGVQRELRTDPAILPFESGDARSAELMQALYKFFGTQCDDAQIDSAVWDHKIQGGLGWWKIRLDFTDDPEGTPIWEAPHPLSVFPDPNWLDAGWKEARYVYQATWYGIDEAVSEWPDYEEDIRRRFGEWLNESTASSSGTPVGSTSGAGAGDSYADLRTWWDKETQRIRVLECWEQTRTRTEVALQIDSGEVTSDPQRIQAMKAALGANPEIAATQRIAFLRPIVKTVGLCHVLDTILLDETPSPYKEPELPLFPTTCYYFWRRPFGVVEPIKDPQREKNVRRSNITEVVQRSPLSGFINKRVGGAKLADIEEYAEGAGVVLTYDSDAPSPIPAPALPQALVYLEKTADEEMQAIINVNDELLGNTTQRTVSGRAITARQRSGLRSFRKLFENHAKEKKLAARFFLRVIQQYVSPTRAARILGTMLLRSQDGQARLSDQAQTFLTQTPADELVALLGTTQLVKFDLVIDQTRVYEASLRQQQLDSLLDLAEKFPGWIPPSVLVEAERDSGALTEKQAQTTLAWIQQRMQMEVAAAQGGAPPNGAAGPPGIAPATSPT